ncbi:MAG: Lipopolysaccharide export system ATP-binding protein LptB [Deltaproteobacteria bacterium ADurb.Bin510]|nr:MAG: Lipopolysaccharide export system ATP-binding protein LptB [Deltaproteobacteria bacterium ADurb.Bin510]
MIRPVLEVNQLSMYFGGLKAIDGIDFTVGAGEIVALIGPNGAGKTTFFNCITGIYKPTQGQIVAHPPDREPVTLNGLKPNQVTAQGLARTFQNIRLFANMTVLENVMVARHCRTRSGILGAVLKGQHTRREERETAEKSYELLKKVGLEKFVNDPAGDLPWLEIARAMATEPFLLLLDEPAAGMNPIETEELDQLITTIRDQEQIAILLIEHDMKLVMKISNRIYVLDHGQMLAQGSPQEIAGNPHVIKAYLGESED